MNPQLYYVPPADATKDQILLRMHHLADEHDLAVIFVKKIDDNDFVVSRNRIKPKPKRLLNKNGVQLPNYMNVRFEKDSQGNPTPVISTVGQVFRLPNRLFGETFHFGILIDESKTKNIQTPS